MQLITVLALALLAVTRPAHAYSCTITKYDEDDIRNAAKDCMDITLSGISVPSNVTLKVDLNQGAKLTFDGITTFGYYEWNGPLINITGTDVEITGTANHVLDVHGNLWWDGHGEHGGTIKPVFFVLHGLNNSIFHHINVKNSPFHAMWIENSEGVTVYDVNIDNEEVAALGKSTDGFNIWSSNNVTLERISVNNQDDCIAIKSGTNVFVNDIYCYGGHGLSIGSVGGRDYSTVENVTIQNIIIEESDNGVRIKTGYEVTGSVTNVTYRNVVLKNIHKFGIIIEGDYNISTGSPTGIATDGVPITDFTLENITGTVIKTGVNIYVLVKNASNWHWSSVNVTGGEAIKPCEGIPEDSGISC